MARLSAAVSASADWRLPPMVTFSDIPVVPCQGRAGQILKGGPIWPDWAAAGKVRHLRGGRPKDEIPVLENQNPTELRGHYFWGGPLVGHFGHLVSECTTRVLQSVSRYPDMVGLFIWNREDTAQPPGHVLDVVEWLGLSRHLMQVVEAPVRVECLEVAEQAEHLPKGEPCDEYLDLLEANSRRQSLESASFSKVYVSRAQLGRKISGRILGERFLESILGNAGFHVIYPEQLPLRQQLSIYAGARQIVFAEGSALHGRQLLGRIDQSVSVIERRPGASIGKAQISRRVCELTYLAAGTLELSPVSKVGVVQPWRTACVLDADRLASILEALGLGGQSGWTRQTFAEAIDAELIEWLDGVLGRNVSRVIDTELSRAALVEAFEDAGLKRHAAIVAEFKGTGTATTRPGPKK
jgi:hypothetical protein